jgi:hypothetical protein
MILNRHGMKKALKIGIFLLIISCIMQAFVVYYLLTLIGIGNLSGIEIVSSLSVLLVSVGMLILKGKTKPQ